MRGFLSGGTSYGYAPELDVKLQLDNSSGSE